MGACLLRKREVVVELGYRPTNAGLPTDEPAQHHGSILLLGSPVGSLLAVTRPESGGLAGLDTERDQQERHAQPPARRPLHDS